MIRRAIVIAIAASSLAACGSSGRSIDASASKLLSAELAVARAAATRGDYTNALADLRQLDAYTAALHDRHQLDDKRAAEISADVAQVRAALDALVTTTTASTTTTTTIAKPAPPAPPARARHGHGKDKGDG